MIRARVTAAVAALLLLLTGLGLACNDQPSTPERDCAVEPDEGAAGGATGEPLPSRTRCHHTPETTP